MSKQSVRKPLSIALGAVVATLGTAGIANAGDATENLFSMEELDSAYLIAGAHETDDGGDKDGEGKCGEDKGGEGKCGEGKCGSA